MILNNIKDQFNQQLINKCAELLNYKCDLIYTSIFDIKDKFTEENITHDIVLLCVRDQFYSCHGFESLTHNESSLIETVIYNVVIKHPSKTFIVFHEHIHNNNMYLEKSTNNVFFVHISGLVDDKEEYTQVLEVCDKNLLSQCVGISLNRNMRPHRLMLISYLHGKKLNNLIYTSATMINDTLDNDLMDIVSWDFSSSELFKEVCEDGFNYIKKNDKLFVSDEAYLLLENTRSIISFDNANNFDKKLRKLYNNSFVEIISETLYDAEFGLVTEKYLNSVYGKNIPIFIAVPGIVSYIRNLGFDVFDDIVDHTYDSILDPSKRMETAIQMNEHLFNMPNQTINKWKIANESGRFNNNITFARDKMYNYFENLALSQFKKILKNKCQKLI